MLPVVIEKQGFRAALAFVITGARPDRIDMPPIIFGLRVNLRIAIDFAGRSLKNPCLHPLCQTKHVDGAMHRRFCRLDRITLIMDGRCRARHIVDVVDLDIEWKRHVMAHELEALMAHQLFDVAPCPGEEIVDAKDFVTLGKQCLAEERADKSGTARDQNSSLQMHAHSPLERRAALKPQPKRQ